MKRGMVFVLVMAMALAGLAGIAQAQQKFTANIFETGKFFERRKT